MPDIENLNIPKANRLLSALSAQSYQRMLPRLERVDLVFAKMIYDLGAVIREVYFPESGIVSLLSAVEERSTLEVGIIGNEGMVGIAVFLGVEISNNLALVQGEGTALKMTASDFLEECRHEDELPRILQRFTHSLITQISQSAACYRFHPIEARLARWLLMTHDRMKTTEFQITQEFLSNMLGVRREAVSKAALQLQNQQIIKYTRGRIEVLNRRGLEANACRCYRIIRNEYENALN